MVDRTTPKYQAISRNATQRQRAKRRVWLHEYKKTLSCVYCGEDNPLCLDLDHIDPSTKKGTPAVMVTGGYKWDDVLDASVRTCKALTAHGAQHLVLIDSISPRRAPTAGRAKDAEQMDDAEWAAYRDRIAHVAKMGAEEYGLTVGIHAHAAGFMDFEPELMRLLDEVDETILKICFDTGHHSYAGFDPVSFMERYIGRISYMHFKDIDPKVKADVIARGTGFYDACGQGIFCNLGEGDVDFKRVRDILIENGFEGWCTVEQDCDPTLPDTDPLGDAKANRAFLNSIGFV